MKLSSPTITDVVHEYFKAIKAGVEQRSNGKIKVGGRDLNRLKRSKVPLLRRNVGCVFQDFKLLPRRTAAENVAYALKVQG